MKIYKTVCVFFLLIFCHAGNSQTSLTLRDQGYCGTPQHQLNTENLSNLSIRTSGLSEPQRHYLPKKSYNIGESALFYTYNFVDEKYQQVNATLRGSMDRLNIWVEDAEWNNFHVIASDVQNILSGLLVLNSCRQHFSGRWASFISSMNISVSRPILMETATLIF